MFDFQGGKDIIAEGNFGTVVRRAVNKQTSEEVAIKVIRLNMLSDKLQEAAKREREILKIVNHPVIFKTYCSFQEKDKILIASEFIRGGEMFDRLISKGFYSERETKRVLKSLCDCIRYLHEDMGIIHRDLKLENLLLRDAEDCTSVVLIDFGFSRRIKEGGCKTDCGTRNYASPEMLLGRHYGKSVDIWALGVTMFILLSGYHPFDTGSQSMLFSNICNGNILYDVDQSIWRGVSPTCKEFLESMLKVDVGERASVVDLCQHSFLMED